MNFNGTKCDDPIQTCLIFQFSGLKHKSIYNDTRNITRAKSSHVERVAVFIHPTVRWNSMKSRTARIVPISATYVTKRSNAAKTWSFTSISIPGIGRIYAPSVRKLVSENDWIAGFCLLNLIWTIYFLLAVASSGNCFSHRKRVHSDKSEVPDLASTAATVTTTTTTGGGGTKRSNAVENSKKLVKAWASNRLAVGMDKRPKFSLLQSFITNLSKSCLFKTKKKWIGGK